MRLDLVGVVVLGVSIILSALLVVTVSSINPLQLSHITYRSSESEFVSSYDSSNDQQSTPSSSSSSSSSSEYYQYKNESSSFGDRFLRFVKRMFWFVPSTSFNNDEDDSEYYSGYLSYDDDDNGDDEDEDDIQSTPEAMVITHITIFYTIVSLFIFITLIIFSPRNFRTEMLFFL